MAQLPDEVMKLLDRGHPVWIATASADGYPNVALKGSGRTADDEHMYFADVFSKKTRTNLEQNPVVAVGIYDAESHVAVQLKGHARLSSSGPLYDTVAAAIKQRGPDLPAPKYVVEIAVESVWDMTAGPNAGNKIG